MTAIESIKNTYYKNIIHNPAILVSRKTLKELRRDVNYVVRKNANEFDTIFNMNIYCADLPPEVAYYIMDEEEILKILEEEKK